MIHSRLILPLLNVQVETPTNGGTNQSNDHVKKPEASTQAEKQVPRFKSANNSATNQKIRKQISLESTSANSSLNDPPHYDEDSAAMLANGLKNLTIKQQERVYSAGKLSS
jgi:hypothetical protein